MHDGKIFSAIDAANVIRAEFKIFVGKAFEQVGNASANEDNFPAEVFVVQVAQNIFLRRKINILAQTEAQRVIGQRVQLVE